MRNILIAAMRGREADSNPSACYLQRLEIGGGITNTLTSVNKDNLVIMKYD